MLNRNEILRIQGTDYKAITLRLLKEADLASLIPSRKARIVIKPNLVTPSAASYGATTHPEVVAGIIEYLQEHRFSNLVIAEGSWVGDKTSESFEVCGYYALSDKYNIPLIDTQKDRSQTVDCSGMRLKICSCARDLDFLINVPVLKGHCQTRVTCALKNMKGLLPNSEKRRFHSMGLHRPIAHLATGIHQDFIVVDHICGDLDFEDGGNPVVKNCVMAGRDPVLMDTYVCKLLHIDPEDVPYIPLAAALGAGSMDLANAAVRSIGSPDDQELPRERKIVALKDAVCEVESCSACYGYLIPALQRLKDEGLFGELMQVLEEIGKEEIGKEDIGKEDIGNNGSDNAETSGGGESAARICIGQGWRGRTGAIGIGNCTSGFDFCVKGCPPTENEIYEALRTYVLGRRIT